MCNRPLSADRFRFLLVLLIAQTTQALHLYSDSDLGSGDTELELHNDLQRPTNNVTHSPAELRRKLEADINEFFDLVPADEVAAKMAEFYNNDFDVHHVFGYLSGVEFARLEYQLVESKEYREVDALLRNLGVNIDAIRRRMDGLFGIPKLIRKFHAETSDKTTVHTAIGGVTGLLDDILSMLPQDGIFILFFDKLDSSLAFSNLVELLGSAEFQLKFDALRRTSHVEDVANGLRDHNVDVKTILDLFAGYFMFGTF